MRLVPYFLRAFGLRSYTFVAVHAVQQLVSDGMMEEVLIAASRDTLDQVECDLIDTETHRCIMYRTHVNRATSR